MFESASILVTVIKFKRLFSFLNFVYLITFKLSFSRFLEHFKKFSSYNTSVFESSNHFSSSFLNAWFFRCQPQHLVPNSLKGFLETKYILFLTSNRNFSSWIFNVQSNVLFLVIISKKNIPNLSHNFSQKTYENLSFWCLVWPILDTKICFYWHLLSTSECGWWFFVPC